MMKKNGLDQFLPIRRKKMLYRINMNSLCKEWEGLLCILREKVSKTLTSWVVDLVVTLFPIFLLRLPLLLHLNFLFNLCLTYHSSSLRRPCLKIENMIFLVWGCIFSIYTTLYLLTSYIIILIVGKNIKNFVSCFLILQIISFLCTCHSLKCPLVPRIGLNWLLWVMVISWIQFISRSCQWLLY